MWRSRASTATRPRWRPRISSRASRSACSTTTPPSAGSPRPTPREAVAEACSSLDLARVVVPPGLPPAWRPRGRRGRSRIAGSRCSELDAINAVLTGCAVAIAETGTLALDGQERSGRRAITLVPDHHICVVEAEQILGLVPQAFASLSDAVREHHAPITLVSGPSASSDIELSRVEGVHGPRHLVVVILT